MGDRPKIDDTFSAAPKLLGDALLFRIFFWVLVALVPAALQAQCRGIDLRSLYPADVVAKLEATVAQEPYAEGLAFDAVRGDTRIFLFGTAHLHELDMPPLVSTRLAAADLLLVEITSLEKAQVAPMLADPNNILRPADAPGLDSVLGEALWPTFRDHVISLGVAEPVAARLQSWFALTLVSVPLCEARGQAQRPNLDARIMSLAADLGVAVAALETPQAALAPLRDANDETLDDVLRQSVTDLPQAEDAITTATLLWREEKPQLLFNLDLLEGTADESGREIEAGLLVDRNLAWMPRILLAADHADEIVVAVGAGHLGGEQGLLVLLEEQGFAITRRNPF